MALVKITPDFFETFKLITHPTRTFQSASNGSLTGSVRLFSQVSPIEKEAILLSDFNRATFDASSLEAYRLSWTSAARGDIISGSNAFVTGSNQLAFAQQYMEMVTSQSVSARKTKSLEITRFEPSTRFTSDTMRKNVVKDILFPFYRPRYPSLQWGVTNYNTLNFLSGSTLANNSCFIYPAASSSITGQTPYRPQTAFTFDFYMNPRYSTVHRDGDYRAGTIFHMSSSYALSVVTSSKGRGIDGKPSKFRLLLQLSHSADILPSRISLNVDNNRRTYPHDLIFLSDNVSLSRNSWHHIGVRWGTNSINNGTGSFVIDGVDRGTFYIPSSSIIPQSFGDPQGDPDALFIGNYYEGRNNVITSLPVQQRVNLVQQFFNSTIAVTDGLTDYTNGSWSIDPPSYAFTHPLYAEVHDLKLWGSYRSIEQLVTSSKEGPSEIREDWPNGLLFYVPPFFVKETRKRDVLQTPFQTYRTTTDDPFNVALSFGVDGYYLNLENYTREFVKNEYPRLLNLSASTIDVTTEWASANGFLNASGSVRKRNLSVFPCDNGRFRPNFSLLASGTSIASPRSGSLESKYTNAFGTLDYSVINLSHMLPTSSLFDGLISPDAGLPARSTTSTGSILGSLEGATPDNPGVSPGSVLTIFQRTRDPSSNQVVFFDASNLFYGNQIKPTTYLVSDPSLTGSAGLASMTFRDDGKGNLYRADSSGSHATWSKVGNILYDEGIAIIMSPTIPYFGKEMFKVELQGTQNIHVFELNVPCKASAVNSSSNPSYKKLAPSDYASNAESGFVYITGLNFHDENLNIIARTNLAQPVVKSNSDRFMFKVKVDF